MANIKFFENFNLCAHVFISPEVRRSYQIRAGVIGSSEPLDVGVGKQNLDLLQKIQVFLTTELFLRTIAFIFSKFL